MSKKRYKIKGTKDFLILAVFCGFICIWSIRDAWFPTKKILKKHPLEIPVAFNVSGVVKSIPVSVGDKIDGKVILASIYDTNYREKVTKVEIELEAAKKENTPTAKETLNVLLQARTDLDACTLQNTDIIWTNSHGEAGALQGEISRILVEPATRVEANEPILMINPHDSFYLFNQSLAIFSFIGVIISLIFHWLASK